MGLPRTKLERQLQLATETLQARTKRLDDDGIEPKQRGLDPKWRTLNAQCRQLRRRLKAADHVVALDDELKRRKTEESGDEE
jgi:hypothetical protein